MFAASTVEEADAIGAALTPPDTRRLLIYGRAEEEAVRAAELHFLPYGTLKHRIVLRDHKPACVYVLTSTHITSYPLRWRNHLACCGIQPLPGHVATRHRRLRHG